MKIFVYIFFICLFSCGYPDIDSVPNFKELSLADEELFDLCELSANDKSEIDNCIEKKSSK